MLSWVMDVEEYERRASLSEASLNMKPVKRCSLILRVLFAVVVIAAFPFIAVAIVSGMFLLGGVMIAVLGR
jgi:nitrate reductase NapE component